MAIALVSVLSGALVTLSVLFLTFRLNRANEHHKWLREKRFEVYAEFLAAIEETRHRSEHEQEELNSALLRYETAIDTALLLAGPRLTGALDIWIEVTETDHGKPWHQRPFTQLSSSYDHLLNSMDKELGVTPG